MSVEERVSDLEERVGQIESILAGGIPQTGRDQYDQHVISKLVEVDQAVSTGQLQRLYRRSGVRDKGKIRDRIKALAEDGLIEKVEPDHWRYVGPAQETLGAAL